MSPSSAPEYILAVVALMLLPASRIISPPLPTPPLPLSFSGGSEAEMILVLSVRLILPPALKEISPPSASAKV